MQKKTPLILLFGASLAAALAACGSDSRSQGTMPVTSSTEPVEPAEPAPPVAETTPAEPAEPPAPPEPPPPTYLHGKFVWFELVSKDPEKSKAFWTQLIGWTAEPQEMEGQTFDLVKADGKEVAIIMATDNKKTKSHWVPFVSVPDVDAAVTAIEQNKGKVVKPAADVPDIGRFAIVADPNGAAFAVFKGAKGDQPDAQPKAGEFVWVENLVKNKKAHQAAVAFYPTVIGYTTNTMEMGTGKKKDTYDMLNYGEVPRAGIDEPKPRSLAGQWLPWVAVDDVDATVAKVKELSKQKLRGKVVTKPHDIPMVGRAAVVTDPTGAALGLLQPLTPEQMKEAAEKAAAAEAAKNEKAGGNGAEKKAP
ncbi:MAG TPA: VOC family protein [Kofleriaceae bacterium]|nr:VOC family protein [Kofleriaceae bacterium]